MISKVKLYLKYISKTLIKYLVISRLLIDVLNASKKTLHDFLSKPNYNTQTCFPPIHVDPIYVWYIEFTRLSFPI